MFPSRASDSFSRRRGHEGTYWLLGGTVAAHVLRVLLEGIDAVSEFEVFGTMGVSKAGLLAGNLWQPLTFLLVHGGVPHLLWNMLVLYVAGRYLEPRLGTATFLTLYATCGVGSALGAWVPAGTDLPVLGAQGAVVGLLMGLLVVGPNIPVSAFVTTIPMRWVVAALFAVELAVSLDGTSEILGPGGGWRCAYWVPVVGATLGLTMLWGWPHCLGPRLKSLQARRARRREVDELERELMEERELDRVLDKIAREGMASLTERERRFLERTSDRYQNIRRS